MTNTFYILILKKIESDMTKRFKKICSMQIFGLGCDASDIDIAVKTCRGQWELSNGTQLWALRNGFSRISFRASDQFDTLSLIYVLL